jgi:hypothetical protein
VRHVLDDSAAIYVCLSVTLAGVVAAVVVNDGGWAVAGWAVGAVAAVIVVAVKTRRRR